MVYVRPATSGLSRFEPKLFLLFFLLFCLSNCLALLFFRNPRREKGATNLAEPRSRTYICAQLCRVSASLLKTLPLPSAATPGILSPVKGTNLTAQAGVSDDQAPKWYPTTSFANYLSSYYDSNLLPSSTFERQGMGGRKYSTCWQLLELTNPLKPYVSTSLHPFLCTILAL